VSKRPFTNACFFILPGKHLQLRQAHLHDTRVVPRLGLSLAPAGLPFAARPAPFVSAGDPAPVAAAIHADSDSRNVGQIGVPPPLAHRTWGSWAARSGTLEESVNLNVGQIVTRDSAPTLHHPAPFPSSPAAPG
jgi:hypothetical protein